MSITYHKATLNELDYLVQSRLDFLLEYWGEQPEKEINHLREELKTYFSWTVSHENYIAIIAKDGENFAGVGGMMMRLQPGSFKNPNGKVAYIMNMYTEPSYRKKGIASAILKELELEALRHGFRMCELHATKEGQPVYMKNGYTLHPEPTFRKYI